MAGITSRTWQTMSQGRDRPLGLAQTLLEGLFARLTKGATVSHLRTDALAPGEIDELWACYSQFVDRPREDFERVLAHATDVNVFRHRRGELIGFEAYRNLHLRVADRSCVVTYTVFADLEPRARGHNFLQMTTLGRVFLLLLRFPHRPLFWAWTSSTYQSYLLLPHNLTEFWPRRERPTPPFVCELQNLLFDELGLDGWDPERGVLSGEGKLRYRVGIVAEDQPDDADAQFFAQRNPGQAHGDALACLIPISAKNVLNLAGSTWARWFRYCWRGARSLTPTPRATT